ncbi:cell division protein DivIVA [Nocardiopsis sp. NPDC050513]|uniref:cell division protein DivIVA n=1 Tax=Nocardiopsis sp. NPDC050513 TaxID=3364338 RepID=UPI0037A343F2
MLPGGGLQQDRFPTVRKGGYDKAHVDDYFVRMDNQFKDLRERLQRMDDELEQYKRDLAIAREKAQVKPEHEQISERMAEILRITEEEAADRRAKVAAEVEETRQKAEEEIAKRRKDSEKEAERIVSSSRTEANEMVSSAKKEADQLREQAKTEGDRRLNEAETRAKKIHDTADRRLATLTATHAEALRRLKDMHSTLADLVTAEDKAGALETGLSREENILPPPDPKAKAAKPAADTAAEPKDARPAGVAKPVPAAKPVPVAKPAGAARPADAPKPVDTSKPADAPGFGDEATTKLTPVKPESDEATVRITPVSLPGQNAQEGPKVADAAPRPPQAAAPPTGGPVHGVPAPGAPAPGGPGVPSGPQQPVTPPGGAADTDITGVYNRPESPQPPKGDEGVRIFRRE